MVNPPPNHPTDHEPVMLLVSVCDAACRFADDDDDDDDGLFAFLKVQALDPMPQQRNPLTNHLLTVDSPPDTHQPL